MPDQYNFNRLGPEVACIDCDVRGPLSLWPTAQREKHHLAHLEAAMAPKPVRPIEKPLVIKKPAVKKPAVKTSGNMSQKKPPAK